MVVVHSLVYLLCAVSDCPHFVQVMEYITYLHVHLQEKLCLIGYFFPVLVDVLISWIEAYIYIKGLFLGRSNTKLEFGVFC